MIGWGINSMKVSIQQQDKNVSHTHTHDGVVHTHECDSHTHENESHIHGGDSLTHECDSHTHNGESHTHKHVHSQQEKKAIINRLSRAIGHMEAVKRMVENDVDCSEVLIQLAAVRSAINNTGKVVLKNHIDHCIVEAIEENDQMAIAKLSDAIDKFVK